MSILPVTTNVDVWRLVSNTLEVYENNYVNQIEIWNLKNEILKQNTKMIRMLEAIMPNRDIIRTNIAEKHKLT